MYIQLIIKKRSKKESRFLDLDSFFEKCMTKRYPYSIRKG